MLSQQIKLIAIYRILLCLVFLSQILHVNAQILIHEERFDQENSNGFFTTGHWSWMPNGKATGGTYWNTREGINSASGGGSMMYNADSLLTSGLIDTSHTDELYASIPLCDTCLNNADILFLEFTYYYRSYEDSIIIRALNWQTEVYDTIHVIQVDKNVETSHKEKLSVPLSLIYAGRFEGIQLSFSYSGFGYFFIMDDLKIWKGLPPRPQTQPQYIGDSLVAYSIRYTTDCDSNAIVPNQLVVQFEARADSIEKVRLRDSLGVTFFNSCSCNPQVELWQLGNHPIPPTLDRDERETSSGLDERVAHASARTQLKGVDVNRFIWNELQEGINRPTLSPLTEADISGLSGLNSGDVVIAVLDAGIDFMHTDLEQYIWKNPQIDPIRKDYVGWNFIQKNNHPGDNHSHGTHLAGIIVQYLLNQAGISNFKLLPLKTHDKNGVGRLFDISCGLYYALDKKAKVINASWGWKNTESSIFNLAMEAVKQQEVVFVTAAGNEGEDLEISPQYPACLVKDPANSHMLSVGSVNETTHVLDTFSNFSNQCVSISAPGNNILSTVPIWWVNATGNPGFKSGTSMSTPAVAAAAAASYCSFP